MDWVDSEATEFLPDEKLCALARSEDLTTVRHLEMCVSNGLTQTCSPAPVPCPPSPLVLRARIARTAPIPPHLPACRTADTSDNSLGDLGQRLPSLRQLRPSGSNISTLRDLGTGLSKLRVLWLARSSLRELEGISAFGCLREAYLAFNEIEDLSPLMNAEKLQVLDLEANAISDPAQARLARYTGWRGSGERGGVTGSSPAIASIGQRRRASPLLTPRHRPPAPAATPPLSPFAPQVHFLQSCTALHSLVLEENPIAETDDYRQQVVLDYQCFKEFVQSNYTHAKNKKRRRTR